MQIGAEQLVTIVGAAIAIGAGGGVPLALRARRNGKKETEATQVLTMRKEMEDAIRKVGFDKDDGEQLRTDIKGLTSAVSDLTAAIGLFKEEVIRSERA